MESRYSVLRPLTIAEQEIFVTQLCTFFSPRNYRDNCKLLKIKADEKTIRPLSFGNFLNYLKIKTDIDSYKYMRHIDVLIQKFVNNGLFIRAGDSFCTGKYHC